jgi:hypothetical protein
MVATTLAGSRVSITFVRNGKQETVTATIDELEYEDEQGRRAGGGSPRSAFGLSLV